MANENLEIKARLNNNLDKPLPVRVNVNINKAVYLLVSRILSEIPVLLLAIFMDGKLTDSEKQMIIDRVVSIVKDALKEL